MPVWLFTTLVVGTLILIGNLFAYHTNGSFNLIYFLLSIFFSTNLFIAYAEICLHLRGDSIESRSQHWVENQSVTGKSPAAAFLTSVIPWNKLLSPTALADIWAAYSYYDACYRDKRSAGFVLDVMNGYFSPIPTLILYVSFANGFVPAVLAGILGLMMFWLWIYTTVSYWIGFVFGEGHRKLSTYETIVWVCLPNLLWIIFPLLGMYVSFQLVVTWRYGLLGM